MAKLSVYHRMYGWLGLLLLAAWPCSAASDNAVILLYHHVSETTPPSTSISPQRFRQHMQYLKQHHQVLPLQQVIEALQQGKPLPDRTVVITFDDGYRNILQNGHPILQEFGFPYTIFISPGVIGREANQLNWDEVKQMHRDGVSFANHSMRHLHLLQRLPGESENAWLMRTEQDILDTERELLQRLGESLKYHAYPYGEFNSALQRLLQKHGYVGFGQHSGAINGNSDFTALPRFAAAGIYANLNSLKVKLNSLAMPVISSSVKDPVLSDGNLAQPFEFTIDSNRVNPARVNCFYLGDNVALKRTANRIQVDVPQPLPPGRSRINCTAPANTKPLRFHWFSQPWFVPTEDGVYLD